MTNKEKEKLIKEALKYKALSAKQALKLLWWNLFRPKIFNIFCNSLSIGMTANAAFRDAEHGYDRLNDER